MNGKPVGQLYYALNVAPSADNKSTIAQEYKNLDNWISKHKLEIDTSIDRKQLQTQSEEYRKYFRKVYAWYDKESKEKPKDEDILKNELTQKAKELIPQLRQGTAKDSDIRSFVKEMQEYVAYYKVTENKLKSMYQALNVYNNDLVQNANKDIWVQLDSLKSIDDLLTHADSRVRQMDQYLARMEIGSGDGTGIKEEDFNKLNERVEELEGKLKDVAAVKLTEVQSQVDKLGGSIEKAKNDAGELKTNLEAINGVKVDSGVVPDVKKDDAKTKEPNSKTASTQNVGKTDILEKTDKLESKIDSIETRTKDTENVVKKVAFHYGTLNENKKTHWFGDEIPSYSNGLRNGGRGWADGTGTYTTADINEYNKGVYNDPLKRFFALDTSNIKQYEAHIEEEAEQFYQFQHKLEQFVIASGSGFKGFDDNIKDVDVNTLYQQAKIVFKNYPEIFEQVYGDVKQFEAFVEGAINLVKQSGIKHDGSTNAKAMFGFRNKHGVDDIKTRFMKSLGFGGHDLSGTSYDGIQSGSVVYDINEAKILFTSDNLDDFKKIVAEQVVNNAKPEVVQPEEVKKSDVKTPEETIDTANKVDSVAKEHADKKRLQSELAELTSIDTDGPVLELNKLENKLEDVEEQAEETAVAVDKVDDHTTGNVADDEQLKKIERLRNLYNDVVDAYNNLPDHQYEEPDYYIYDWSKAKEYVDFDYDGEDMLPSSGDIEEDLKSLTEREDKIKKAIQLTYKKAKDIQNAVDKHGGFLGDTQYDQNDVNNINDGLKGLFEMYVANGFDLDDLDVKMTKPFKAMAASVKEDIKLHKQRQEQYDAETKSIIENNHEQINAFEQMRKVATKAFRDAGTKDETSIFKRLPDIYYDPDFNQYTKLDDSAGFEQLCDAYGIELSNAADVATANINKVNDTLEEQNSVVAEEKLEQQTKEANDALEEQIDIFTRARKIANDGNVDGYYMDDWKFTKQNIEDAANLIFDLQEQISKETDVHILDDLKRDLKDAQIHFVALYDVVNDVFDYKLDKPRSIKKSIKDLRSSVVTTEAENRYFDKMAEYDAIIDKEEREAERERIQRLYVDKTQKHISSVRYKSQAYNFSSRENVPQASARLDTPFVKQASRIKTDVTIPQDTSNSTNDEVAALKPLEAELDKVTQAVNAKTTAFLAEKKAVEKVVQSESYHLGTLLKDIREVHDALARMVPENVISSENADLSTLSGKFNGVTESIENKNKAIYREQTILHDAVGSELRDLENLRLKIETVRKAFANILNATDLKNIDAGSVDIELINQINTLKDALEGNAKWIANLKNLYDELSKLNLDPQTLAAIELLAPAIRDLPVPIEDLKKAMSGGSAWTNNFEPMAEGLKHLKFTEAQVKNLVNAESALQHLGAFTQTLKDGIGTDTKWVTQLKTLGENLEKVRLTSANAKQINSFVTALKDLKQPVYQLKQTLKDGTGWSKELDKIYKTVKNFNLDDAQFDGITKVSIALYDLGKSLNDVKLLVDVNLDQKWLNDLSEFTDKLKKLKFSDADVKNIDNAVWSINYMMEEMKKMPSGEFSLFNDVKELLADAENLKNLATVLKTVEKDVKKARKKVKGENKGSDKKTDDVIKDTSKEAEQEASDVFDDANKTVDKFTKKLEKAEDELRKFKAIYGGENKLPEFDEIYNELDEQRKNIASQDDLDVFNNKLSKTRTELNRVQKLREKGWKSTDFGDDMQKAYEFYKKMDGVTIDPVRDADGSIRKFTAEFKDAEGQLHRVRVEANGLSKAIQTFSEVNPKISAVEKLGTSIKDTFKYFKHYLTGYFSLQEVIQAVRYGVQSIVELDTAMVELRKVSKDSSYAIDNYFSVATESAKELGATVGDLLNATADWSRMGYNLNDAKELAEISTLYMHVGDGIDIDQASSSLVSTMKGFHMEAEDAMGIIDKFNEVANTNPIESGGIGEALQRSAASFYMANTDLSSAIALITASNSVVQDPEKVGNMWKTVSARIRGAATEVEEMGEDTEGMVESTSKLRDEIMAMTGFDIMKDDNTFKDMREIIVGIGQEWDKLSDIDQAALLEKLAGKNHANTLAAALSQYEMINDVYETAENSEGSALREQEEYMKSLQYSIDRGKASVQEFWSTLLDSGFLKSALDFGTKFLNVLTDIMDTLGTLPTLLSVGLPILQNTKFFPKDFRLTYVTCHGILVPYYI